MKQFIKCSGVSGRAERAACVAGLFAVALLLIATSAQAGGLAAASSALSTFQTWLYSIVGVVCGIYLTYEGIKCLFGHGDWVRDFGYACLKVVGAGCCSVLTVFLVNLFLS